MQRRVALDAQVRCGLIFARGSFRTEGAVEQRSVPMLGVMRWMVKGDRIHVDSLHCLGPDQKSVSRAQKSVSLAA
ncbi:hypothetical protein MES5069_1030003 [Mesorhizobium escarrei]|uniref:Transposase n=1 Tax=Mesorhizobium escarrei TaxID=666018 RepID=A0ABM9DHJ2_9HYPH|nr:hypothetical protein MES5069_1030003 [Mesorhizobium escarrei]